MLDRRALHPARQLLDADEVGEEGVGEEQRERQVDRMLRQAARVESAAAVHALRGPPSALDPALERTARLSTIRTFEA